MSLEIGDFCAWHHGAKKDGFVVTTVIREVTMRLAEGGNDLRHLKTERPIRVSERGAMALHIILIPFGRVRPVSVVECFETVCGVM